MRPANSPSAHPLSSPRWRRPLLIIGILLAFTLPAASPDSAPPLDPGSNPCSDAPETALRLETQLDRDTLLAAGSAPVSLLVVGTLAPVELLLVNETPGVVSLAGGNHQRITTSGGLRNHVERILHIDRSGRFELHASLLDRCTQRGR